MAPPAPSSRAGRTAAAPPPPPRHRAFIAPLRNLNLPREVTPCGQPNLRYAHSLLESAQAGGAWPAASEHPCLNDGHPFPGRPVAIPRRLPGGAYGPKLQVIEYQGTFCSFPCARRYAVDRREVDLPQVLEHLETMERAWRDEGLLDYAELCRLAPEVPLLAYRHLTLDEYRAGSLLDGRRLAATGRPFTPGHLVLEVEQGAPQAAYPCPYQLPCLAGVPGAEPHLLRSLRRPAPGDRGGPAPVAPENSFLNRFLQRREAASAPAQRNAPVQVEGSQVRPPVEEPQVWPLVASHPAAAAPPRPPPLNALTVPVPPSRPAKRGADEDLQPPPAKRVRPLPLFDDEDEDAE